MEISREEVGEEARRAQRGASKRKPAEPDTRPGRPKAPNADCFTQTARVRQGSASEIPSDAPVRADPVPMYRRPPATGPKYSPNSPSPLPRTLAN